MFDLDTYRPTMRIALKRWEARLGHEDKIALVDRLTQGYDCPRIVAAYLTGEEYGFDAPLQAHIDSLERQMATYRVKNRKGNHTDQEGTS